MKIINKDIVKNLSSKVDKSIVCNQATDFEKISTTGVETYFNKSNSFKNKSNDSNIIKIKENSKLDNLSDSSLSYSKKSLDNQRERNNNNIRISSNYNNKKRKLINKFSKTSKLKINENIIFNYKNLFKTSKYNTIKGLLNMDDIFNTQKEIDALIKAKDKNY